MIETKNRKSAWIAFLSVLCFLALVFGLDQLIKPTDKLGMLLIVLQKGSVYALAAVSMNLLNGYTGLFSLGHAGFMLLGAYTYAIFTIPDKNRDAVYQYFDAAIRFSIPEQLSKSMGGFGTALGILIALLLAGLVAAVLAWLIGLPVLRLKSDYLAIATLGFAEIIRAVFQWSKLGPVTNGSNLLKNFARASKFKLEIAGMKLSLSTFVPVLIATVSITLIVLLVNSTYGRAFKAIRDDEVAADAFNVRVVKALAPAGTKCFVYDVAKASEKLMVKGLPDERIIVLAKTPTTFNRLIKAGVPIKEVNLGGAGIRGARKPFINNVSLDPEEVKACEEMKNAGCRVYYQLVPDQKRYDISAAIEDALKGAEE